jgi:glycosyltransferase involved in cell wall biosynthesis
MPPKVSVILPTYNRSRTLPAAISSVLTQSERDLELIVVDDASSEDIAGVLRQFDDPRLRLIRRPVNGGAAAARNSGLAEARGRFIAFQDSDDLWLPGKLERQLALLGDLPPAFGAVTSPKILYGRDDAANYGPGRVCITPSVRGRLPRAGDQVGWLLGDNRLSVQCALFRSDSMPTRRWFDECARANEDYEFAVRLAQHTRIFESEEPLALGFVSADSISRSGRRELMGQLRIMKNNRVLLRKYPRQRAMFMRNIARQLKAEKKPRWGARFLLSSLAHHPASVVELGRIFLRKLGAWSRNLPAAPTKRSS